MASGVPGYSSGFSTKLPVALFVAFAIQCVVLAWAPHNRGDWLLENLIAIPFAIGLFLARRRLPFSSASWLCIFAFLALHEVGSHYTYSLVPWADWSRDLLGFEPTAQRNHFDRAVHLAFGLLLTWPLWQLCAVRFGNRLLTWTLPFCYVATFSCLYELMEWAAAVMVDPGIGVAFVGAQGDPWDAQKDMALALAGSLAVSVGGWLRLRLF